MVQKVTRAKRVAKQRVRKSAARAQAHDSKLLEQAAKEAAEGVDGAELPTIWAMADQIEGNDHMYVGAIELVNSLLGVVLSITQDQQREHLWDRQHAGALAQEAVEKVLAMRKGDADAAMLLRDIARKGGVTP